MQSTDNDINYNNASITFKVTDGLERNLFLLYKIWQQATTSDPLQCFWQNIGHPAASVKRTSCFTESSAMIGIK